MFISVLFLYRICRKTDDLRNLVLNKNINIFKVICDTILIYVFFFSCFWINVNNDAIYAFTRLFWNTRSQSRWRFLLNQYQRLILWKLPIKRKLFLLKHRYKILILFSCQQFKMFTKLAQLVWRYIIYRTVNHNKI